MNIAQALAIAAAAFVTSMAVDGSAVPREIAAQAQLVAYDLQDAAFKPMIVPVGAQVDADRTCGGGVQHSRL